MIREHRRVVNHAAALLLFAGCWAPPGSREFVPAPGLEARLTLLDTSPKLSGRFRVRLELSNRGSTTYRYDSQQVDVNDSLVVRGPAGPATYIYGSYQTLGNPKDLKPGETVLLFDELDVARQYSVAREGRYTVQWAGRGLSLARKDALVPPEEQMLWTSPLYVVSNIVDVVVAPGELSDLDALAALLVPVLPRPWELTCAEYGTPERHVLLTRTAALKVDLLRADVRLGERPAPSAELVGEFRGKKVWLVSPPAAVDEIKPALRKALH